MLFIAVRVGAVPFPCGFDDDRQTVKFRFPTENGFRLIRGRDQHSRIACPAAFVNDLDVFAGNLFCRFDDLIDREPDAVAEIEDIALAAIHKIVHGKDMRYKCRRSCSNLCRIR